MRSSSRQPLENLCQHLALCSPHRRTLTSPGSRISIALCAMCAGGLPRLRAGSATSFCWRLALKAREGRKATPPVWSQCIGCPLIQRPPKWLRTVLPGTRNMGALRYFLQGAPGHRKREGLRPAWIPELREGGGRGSRSEWHSHRIPAEPGIPSG
jgi:hypothetical protein